MHPSAIGGLPQGYCNGCESNKLASHFKSRFQKETNEGAVEDGRQDSFCKPCNVQFLRPQVTKQLFKENKLSSNSAVPTTIVFVFGL